MVKCHMGGFPNPKDCSKCVCPDGYGGRYCDERPSGCGKILKATTDYGHLEDTVGYPGVTNSSDAPDDFLKCNYWIQAPQGRRIEVALVKYNDSVATDGCYLAGIEIKTQKDQRATGYRICSPAYRGWVFRSESNIVPIITYSRVWPTEAVLRYRMGT
ncbi:unnamed protein product [Cylicostephanus goldi]|uniref:CUB domain-containing protein n=1 Tax=Cylicostephanus goldi TaxID=71465 RepID=A0A3P6TNH2_CYLGO|nr:unnamed protein product [Cylicostephanus goldi]